MVKLLKHQQLHKDATYVSGVAQVGNSELQARNPGRPPGRSVFQEDAVQDTIHSICEGSHCIAQGQRRIGQTIMGII